MKFFLAKDKFNAFIPFHDEDEECASKLQEGDVVEVVTKKKREIWFHRKFFLMLSYVLDAMPENAVWEVPGGCLISTMPLTKALIEWPQHELRLIVIKTTGDLLYHLKLQLGYYEQKVSLGGKINYEAKSISFEKMDQDEFEKFYNDSLDVITKYFLPMDERQRRLLLMRINNDFVKK